MAPENILNTLALPCSKIAPVSGHAHFQDQTMTFADKLQQLPAATHLAALQLLNAASMWRRCKRDWVSSLNTRSMHAPIPAITPISTACWKSSRQAKVSPSS